MKIESKKLAYVEGILSIAINTVLFILKYWVGTMTGSIAIIADAWHTLSDSLTSAVVILGAKVSSKPADQNHPFGHGRAESVASIIISVLLFVVGCNFFLDAIQRLWSRDTAVFTTSAIIVFTISVLAKEAIAQFSFWAYKKTKSHSLKADGWHHRSDSIASAIILASIFLGGNLWWIDGVFGIIVSILIAYTSIDIMKEAVLPVLGKKPNRNSIKKIVEIGERYNFTPNDIHHIHEHSYGSHLEYTMHIYMPRDSFLQEAHVIINNFRGDLRRELNIESTIYMETK